MRFALLLLLLPAVAHAQPSSSPDTGTMVTDDCARARKAGRTCVINIGPEDITKDVVGPETTVVDVRTIARHGSLIRIRKDFIAEILKSANDLD
jgi:hypothetical protein